MSIVTLSERKEREAKRRTEAARAVMERLQAFVSETGHRGRFIIFGSAVAGSMRHDSDLDVIIDFPKDTELAAWRVVEDACRDWNVPADVLSAATTTATFLEKVMARPVRVIG